MLDEKFRTNDVDITWLVMRRIQNVWHVWAERKNMFVPILDEWSNPVVVTRDVLRLFLTSAMYYGRARKIAERKGAATCCIYL